MASANGNFDKTMGIVAYMTLIGWIVAIAQNGSKSYPEKQFTAFHLRQMLGLMIIYLGIWIIQIPLHFIPYLGYLISTTLSLGVFVLWIIGVVGAANGEKKPLPLIGEPVQKTLGKMFD